MNYEYQAVDANGDIVRGIIEAKDPQKVFNILQQLQYLPIEIRPLTESTKELSRLHNLKKKLEDNKKMKPIKKEASKKKFSPTIEVKSSIDWTYIIFILMMLGVMVAAALL